MKCRPVARTYSPHVRDIETIDGELRLLARAWRVARHLGCTPSTELIDQLLDERAATTRCGVYQSCVDRGGTAPRSLKAALGSFLATRRS